jgi:cyclase
MQEIEAYPCEIVTEIVGRDTTAVPHYLPGENPMLTEYAERFDLPLDAIRGGAETALPEFLVSGRSKAIEEGPDSAVAPPPSAEGLQVIPVQGNVYTVVGAGGNVVVQVGEDGVFVVDTGLDRLSSDLLDTIEGLAAGKEIRWVVNTHVHGDHTGGNLAISSAGEALAGGDFANNIDDAGVGANIVAHESVLVRMSQGVGDQPPPPFRAWPTLSIIADRKEIFFNDEAVQIYHAPAAHTDGDLIVFFRKSDVVVTGDVYVTTSYPGVSLAQGGSIDGEIDALNRIIDLTVPRLNQEAGTYVVPGHGRIVDESDVVDYRDMVTIVRDRVRALIDDGLTLDEVQAARPTRDYDGRFAAATGRGAAATFVETVYRSLGGAEPGVEERGLRLPRVREHRPEEVTLVPRGCQIVVGDGIKQLVIHLCKKGAGHVVDRLIEVIGGAMVVTAQEALEQLAAFSVTFRGVPACGEQE